MATINALLATLVILGAPGAVHAGGRVFDVQHHHHHHHPNLKEDIDRPTRTCEAKIATFTLAICGDVCPPEPAKELAHSCQTNKALTDEEIKELCCPTVRTFGSSSSKRTCAQKISAFAIATCGEPCGPKGAKTLLNACSSGKLLSSSDVKAICCPSNANASDFDSKDIDDFSENQIPFGGAISNTRSCITKLNAFALATCGAPCEGMGEKTLQSACNSGRRLSSSDVKAVCCP